MAFNIGKIFGGAAGLVAGLPGALVGAKLGDKVLGGGGEGTDAFGLPMDPRLKEIAEEERKNAEAYEKNAAGYARELQDQGAATARRDLATQMRSNAENASARGLLGSGIQKGADAAASRAAATDVANTSRAANDTVNSTRDSLGYDAANAALRQYGIQADTAASNYDLAMQRAKQNQAGLNSLGKGVGAVAGYSAAKNASTPKTTTPAWGGGSGMNYSNYA